MLTSSEYAKQLLTFIQSSPTSFQAVETVTAELREKGFSPLQNDAGSLHAGGYYVTRNQSAVIAFVLPAGMRPRGFSVFAAHTDSPTFKLKPVCEQKVQQVYTRLNVERYGGMICASFMDRPLSVAGRLIVAAENGVESRLVHMKEDMALIPNVAIHMNRNVNEGMAYNPQVDMLPLVACGEEGTPLLSRIAAANGIDPSQVLSHDLYLYNREPGCIWGEHGEFVSAPRLDDLLCAFAGLCALDTAENPDTVPVLALFDNEEVGSNTRAGAASSFLSETLDTVRSACRMPADALQNSLLLSADNAHAVHPNHPEYADAQNKPVLGGGVVVKYNAAQQYCTDALSAALLRTLCRKANVPCQDFANRSDMRGGSTLGNIAATRVPIPAVDIGLPQLAMHSAYETAGSEDLYALIRLADCFFRTAFTAEADGRYGMKTAER